MEKVMILGAGPLQVPAIQKAKELGFWVVVCDYDPNAMGFDYADEKYLISSIDMKAVLEKAKEIQPDYVITSTSDAPVRTAAYVSEKLGLAMDISYENAVCATVKSNMRIRLKEHHVPIPTFYICHNENEFLEAVGNFREECIIKPSDSAASRGVVRVTTSLSKEELLAHYAYCLASAKNGVVMVEELMHGPEVSVECFVVNQKVNILAITDKLVTQLPYFVELGHSEQSQLGEEIQEKIREVARQAINAIGIVNGVSHVEIKVTEEGPKVVEIAARLGGDYITSKLVPLSTGIDMVGSSICLALHKPFDVTRSLEKGSAIRFITGKEGVIREIKIPENVYEQKGLYELQLYCKIGDRVHDVKSSNDRIGHIITQGENAADAISIAEEILEQIKVIIE